MKPARAHLALTLNDADRAAHELLRRAPDDSDIVEFIARVGGLSFIAPGPFDALLELDPIVLAWLRDTIACPGFGGCPTYAERFSVLERALAQGEPPPRAAVGAHDPVLLDVGRSVTRLHLDVAARARLRPRLSRTERRWPCLTAREVARVVARIPPQYVDMFHRDYVAVSQVLTKYLEFQLRDMEVPRTPSKNHVSFRVNLTEELKGDMVHTYLLVSITNRSKFEQPEPSESDGDDLPKANAEPIELQVAAFQRRLGRVLDDVLIGQRYIISARTTPKAVLRPLTRRAPAGASTVMRREFADDLSAYLNEVQAGAILVVGSAKEPAPPPPRADAVVARPAPKRLVDERRALAEEERKQSGRARMRKVRDGRRRADAEKQAEMDAKLRAVEDMTVAEVEEAARTFLKKNK